MAASIEMPFGSRTLVGTRSHVLDGGTDPHGNGKFFCLLATNLIMQFNPVISYRTQCTVCTVHSTECGPECTQSRALCMG